MPLDRPSQQAAARRPAPLQQAFSPRLVPQPGTPAAPSPERALAVPSPPGAKLARRPASPQPASVWVAQGQAKAATCPRPLGRAISNPLRTRETVHAFSRDLFIVKGGILMPRLHIAGVLIVTLCGPAFAGAPTPPTPPTPVSGRSMTVSQTQLITVTGGAKVNANMHVGSLAFADSASVKTTVVLGASQSVSTAGFTVP
jgi:hypothetical protein